MDSTRYVHSADLPHSPSANYSHSSLSNTLGGLSTAQSEVNSHEMKEILKPSDADVQRDLEKQAKQPDKGSDQPAKDPNLVCKRCSYALMI